MKYVYHADAGTAAAAQGLRAAGRDRWEGGQGSQKGCRKSFWLNCETSRKLKEAKKYNSGAHIKRIQSETGAARIFYPAWVFFFFSL